MITNASLKTYSVRDLTELAKSQGLAGWRSMKRDQLIQALMKTSKKKSAPPPAAKAKVAARSRVVITAKPSKPKKPAKPVKPAKLTVPAMRVSNQSSGRKPASTKPSAAKTSSVKHVAPKKVIPVVAKAPTKTPENKADKLKSDRITRKIHAAHEKKDRFKDLAHAAPNGKEKHRVPEKDRIVLLVRDAFWLHAMWQINRISVARAQAAMAEHWHTARPILRVLEVDAGHTTSTAERIVREIEVHGGVQNWYVEVHDSPKSLRVELGYKAVSGKFFSIVRSNVITTPAPGSSDAIDENWSAIAQDYEKIYALSGGYSEERASGELQELFEERLRRPMGPSSARYGMGAERLINRHKNFRFDVDAEMIIFGTTNPDAKVTLGGEPVKLRPDGTFTVRIAMPDKRQVIPAVASSGDGVEQRTVVLAVERNTKVLEPMMREQNND